MSSSEGAGKANPKLGGRVKLPGGPI